jgi:hypothetical protein
MKNISLKLQDDVFSETEKILSEIKVNRNKYINMAIENYNKAQKRKIIGEILKKESVIVRENSMKVLAEFEAFLDEGIDGYE